jgi:hypothetical protein
MLRRLVSRFIAFWLIAFCLSPPSASARTLANSGFKAAA